MAIKNLSKNRYIPRYDRGMDGEINLASFCSSGIRCSMPGRLDFVQLHALGGVQYIAPPPPPHSIAPIQTKKYRFINTIFSFSLQKRRPLLGTAFFI